MFNFTASWKRFFSFFKKLRSKTFRAGYLNKVELRPRFRNFFDLQISFLMGYFKKKIAFLVYPIRFHETVLTNRRSAN